MSINLLYMNMANHYLNRLSQLIRIVTQLNNTRFLTMYLSPLIKSKRYYILLICVAVFVYLSTYIKFANRATYRVPYRLHDVSSGKLDAHTATQPGGGAFDPDTVPLPATLHRISQRIYIPTVDMNTPDKEAEMIYQQ